MGKHIPQGLERTKTNPAWFVKEKYILLFYLVGGHPETSQRCVPAEQNWRGNWVYIMKEWLWIPKELGNKKQWPIGKTLEQTKLGKEFELYMATFLPIPSFGGHLIFLKMYLIV